MKGAHYEFETRRTLNSTSSRHYSHYSAGLVIITERRGTRKFELLPLSQLEDEIPFLLLDDFSHWWNREKNTVEFRPTSFEREDFLFPKYELHINTRDLVEVATKNVMTFIGDGIHDKVIKILSRIEFPKYTLIWKQDGEIVVKLPRYGVTFKWERNGLVCPEYNDMRVNPHFQLGTLVGLEQYLVLEGQERDARLVNRMLLIPHGNLQPTRGVNKQKKFDNLIVTTTLRQPPYFIYQVNDVLKMLTGGQSTAAWLYLAALHATTTTPLVDPWSGLTGLEMAVHILQSGHAWSGKPYDEESLATLQYINGLSPIRISKSTGSGRRDEDTKKVEQDLKFSPEAEGLCSYARYDGYHLIVQKLMEGSRKVGFLFGKPGKDPLKEEVRDSDLMKRGYWTHIWNYNEAAWIKPEFRPEVPASESYTFSTKFPIRSSLPNLRIMSALTHDWKPVMQGVYSGNVRRLVYEKENFQGLKPLSDDDCKYFSSSAKLRDYWLQLYAKALEVGKEPALIPSWIELMCTLAYQKDTGLQDLLILHTVAVNSDKFPQAPKIKSYTNIQRKYFEVVAIRKLLESSGRYYRHSQDYYEMDAQQRAEKLKSWETAKASWISKEVEEIEKKWTVWNNSTPESETRQLLKIKPFSNSEFMETTAHRDVNSKFENWENNLKLHLFIQKVENALTSCLSDTALDSGFSWNPPTSSQLQRTNNIVTIPNLFLSRVTFPGVAHLEGEEVIVDSLYQELVNPILEDDELKNLRVRNYPPRMVKERFTRELEELETKGCRLLEQLKLSWKRIPEDGYFGPAGLSPRIVPLKILPLILEGWDTELHRLVLCLAEVWTRSQRAIRILKYANAGESREVHLRREIETRGHGNWDPRKYPEWIILELEMNLMIRDIQVDIARNMLDGGEGSSVTQLNMGEGKTSVILPMLASILARNRTSSVRITVLKSLYETNFKSLSHALGGILNARVQQFPCNRDLVLTSDQVELILQLHQDLKRNGGVILTIPEYRLSWELRAYESAGKDGILCNKFMNLVNWVYAETRDILDESDEILSVKYQKVYALGVTKKVEELHWKIAQTLLKSIPATLRTLTKKYKSCIEMGSSQNAMVKGDSFQQPSVYTPCRLLNYTDESQECYGELIAQLATEFVQQEFNGNEDCQTLVKAYLTDPAFPQQDYETLFSLCHSEDDSVLGKKFQKAQIMAEFLVHPGILQSCLNKRWRVNYGVNPKSKQRRIAVPFVAKDVAHEKTEFGHPSMAIFLTTLSYYYSGLTDAQLLEVFSTLEKHIENPRIEYDSWISSIGKEQEGNARTVPYSALNLEFPKQRAALFKVLRKNVHVIDFWLSHCVFPKEVRIFPDKITCTAWDLCHSGKRCVGFSGTNDMSLLLPKWITPKDLPALSATNEEVRAAVEQSENYESLTSWVSSSAVILKILHDGDMRVLIDAGALITDATNAQLAEKWLEIDRKMEAVVFFNDQNQLTVKNREKIDTPFELSPYSEKLDQCAVYLDDEHTRGTDLRFPDGTVGCVTLGGRMTRDKLVQACLRLRLLQSGHHKVSFLASREAHNQIKSLKSKEDQEEEPTAVDVMNWVCHDNKEFIKEGLVFWANSGLNFAQKRSALTNFAASRNHYVFGNQIQDGGGAPKSDSSTKENYKTQQTFVQILPAMFEQSKFQQLVGAEESGTEVKAGIHGWYSEVQEHVMDTCLGNIPNHKCFSNNLDEEQEREIEQEIEIEQEVSRPRPATPYTPQLDPSIVDFIRTGIFSPGTAMQETQFKGLYASKDFLRTTNPNIVRPVQWISTSANYPKVLLILSQFEVNGLILEYRRGKPKGIIYMFAPRLRKDQPILLKHPRLQLKATPSADSYNFSGEDLAKLHLYAGSLYFDPECSEEEAKCYEMVIKAAQEDKGGSGFNAVTFIGKNIEDRHQHFPEKSDLFKFLKW